MKPILSLTGRKFLLIFTLTFSVIITRAQDIPVAVPNLQTIPSGSLVIPMGNTHQVTSGGMFNLKAYGFVVDLLNHAVLVRWVIKSGKAHDAIDFTATAERLEPTALASQSRDFVGGPFVIFPADTAAVISHLRNMNDSLAAGEKVSIYRLTQSVVADIRYNLMGPPKVAILNDGIYSQAHVNYMQYASIPYFNYQVMAASGLASGCYTIATDPHTDDVSSAINPVRAFILNGGNFLAQCKGVISYENEANGHFHTTGGIAQNNTGLQANTIYPNADMAFSQFQGIYVPNQNGHTRLWENNVLSLNQNNCYSVVGNSLLPGLTGASVSKLGGALGGVVFYLGNHEFSNLNNVEDRNGIRMYLNALLVPTRTSCWSEIWKVLPVKLEDFTAQKKTNTSSEIKWTVSNEEEDSRYVVERSNDGKNFSVLKIILPTGIESMHSYSYIDSNPLTGANYYRIRMENAAGSKKYSEVKAVLFSKEKGYLSIYPNPSGNLTRLIVSEKDGENLQVSIYDAAGRQAKKSLITVQSEGADLDLNGLGKGIYWITVTTSNGEQLRTKLMKTQ